MACRTSKAFPKRIPSSKVYGSLRMLARGGVDIAPQTLGRSVSADRARGTAAFAVAGAPASPLTVSA
jgi:hypothetical protein